MSFLATALFLEHILITNTLRRNPISNHAKHTGPSMRYCCDHKAVVRISVCLLTLFHGMWLESCEQSWRSTHISLWCTLPNVLPSGKLRSVSECDAGSVHFYVITWVNEDISWLWNCLLAMHHMKKLRIWPIGSRNLPFIFLVHNIFTNCRA